MRFHRYLAAYIGHSLDIFKNGRSKPLK
jgi:hypothetical protein